MLATMVGYTAAPGGGGGVTRAVLVQGGATCARGENEGRGWRADVRAGRRGPTTKRLAMLDLAEFF